MKLLTWEDEPSGRRIGKLCGFRVLSLRHYARARCLKRQGASVLIIRVPSAIDGIFSHFTHNLGWMRWASERGHRSYVDMRTPLNIFNREGPVDFNPWELFFKQSCGPLDVLNARTALTTDCGQPDFPGVFLDLYDQDSEAFRGWRRFTHENIALADSMARMVESRHAELFGNDDRVLGCLVRGTDYTAMRPSHHPVQPTPQQVIADAKRICAERGMRKVFLATEDRDVREMFAQAFGSSLIVSQTERPAYKADLLANSGARGDLARTIEISTQYLVSIALLARCRCLLAGCTSGTMGAALLSDGYEVMQVYKLGYYP